MTTGTLSKRDRFYETAPKVAFFLDLNKEGLESYLWGRRWLESGEFVLTGEVAGQGNMPISSFPPASNRGVRSPIATAPARG
jgi:hypothetical protein